MEQDDIGIKNVIEMLLSSFPENRRFDILYLLRERKEDDLRRAMTYTTYSGVKHTGSVFFAEPNDKVELATAVRKYLYNNDFAIPGNDTLPMSGLLYSEWSQLTEKGKELKRLREFGWFRVNEKLKMATPWIPVVTVVLSMLTIAINLHISNSRRDKEVIINTKIIVEGVDSIVQLHSYKPNRHLRQPLQMGRYKGEDSVILLRLLVAPK